jgi:hypothetical protein
MFQFCDSFLDSLRVQTLGLTYLELINNLFTKEFR